MKNFSQIIPEKIILPKVRIDVYKYDGEYVRAWWGDSMLKKPNGLITLVSKPPFFVVDKARFIEFPYRTRQYFSTNKWFNLIEIENVENQKITWYCNLATPPEYISYGLKFIDLDLDIVSYPKDKSWEILDEDEFEENQIKYRYPKDLVERVRHEQQRIIKILKSGVTSPEDLF